MRAVLYFNVGLNVIQWKCFLIHHSEDVLPSIHADKYYPCELVGTWNTWYGEQDQAGRITNIDIQTSAVQQVFYIHKSAGMLYCMYTLMYSSNQYISVIVVQWTSELLAWQYIRKADLPIKLEIHDK